MAASGGLASGGKVSTPHFSKVFLEFYNFPFEIAIVFRTFMHGAGRAIISSRAAARAFLFQIAIQTFFALIKRKMKIFRAVIKPSIVNPSKTLPIGKNPVRLFAPCIFAQP